MTARQKFKIGDAVELSDEGRNRFNSPRNEWVSVEERLPEERERVLIVHVANPDNMHYPKRDVELAFMADGEWFDAADTRNMAEFNNTTWTITHWQPLPAPPVALKKE